ncbi:hypothetical protein [Candidatus Sororendozoicomonas aggregata]|uniref:hypothetical protein n=1 Tax=Candidatus Sororendozoicomonas aggregata TaxID=3073239 RepID=UPI002ED1D9D0
MLKLASFIITLLFCSSAMASGLAVSPLVVEIKTAPGKQSHFTFNVTGKKKQKIKLTVQDMSQLETGHMGFMEVGQINPALSKISWVNLEKDIYSLRQDQTITIKGTVKPPTKTSGNHVVAVMVEEYKEEDEKQGISVNVRYAVIVNIVVIDKKRKARLKSSFYNFELVRLDEKLMVMGDFVNKSAFEGQLKSEVQIRNADRKMVAKVAMKTESSWQRQDEASRVFPSAQVKVFGFIETDLSYGEYEFKVRNRFSGKTQPSFKTKITYDENIRQILRKVPPEEKKNAEGEEQEGTDQAEETQATEPEVATDQASG